MRKISKQTFAHTAGASGWFSGCKGLTKALGGVLLLALISGSSPVFGAILPSPGVTLKWNPSASSEVAGYRIYYGAASGDYTNSIGAGNVTSNTISGLVPGATYYFAVKAYDASAVESTFSNEIGYTVPGGPASLQLRVAANKQAILTLTGKSNHTYEIQATPNLTTWTVLGTVTLGASGTGSYTNTNAGSFPTRFYRTRDTQP